MKYIRRIKNTTLEIEELLQNAAKPLQKAPEDVRKEDLRQVRDTLKDINAALSWMSDAINMNIEVLVADEVEKRMREHNGIRIYTDHRRLHSEINATEWQVRQALKSLVRKNLLYETVFRVIVKEQWGSEKKIFSYEKLPKDYEFKLGNALYRRDRRVGKRK